MKKIINFAKYSTIKIGQEEEVTLLTKENPIPPKNAVILGGCSNILLSTTPPPLVMLSKEFDYIKIKDDLLYVGGATPNGKLFSFCKKNNIANFEFLSHLPGKMGGTIKMNAGMKAYEIFDNLVSIKTTNGVLNKKDITYDYRYTNIEDIVLEARFQIMQGFDEKKVLMFKKMRSNQPKEFSAGSCFKNPPNNFAGKLIEEVGFKGKRYGDMAFSPIHANFLINYGNGTYKEAIELINAVKAEVKTKRGIELELEIRVI